MPNYDFQCTQCGKIEERLVPISKKDEVTTCSCEEQAEMKRLIGTPLFVYDRGKSVYQKAGDGWKEVQQRIQAASGRNNTIRTK